MTHSTLIGTLNNSQLPMNNIEQQPLNMFTGTDEGQPMTDNRLIDMHEEQTFTHSYMMDWHTQRIATHT